MDNYWENVRSTMRKLTQNPPEELKHFVDDLFQAWSQGGKVISFGNGGSATDSLHFTAELVGRFREEAIARPAISLNSNTATVTAVSNDWSYDEVFSRQLEARANSSDLVLGISTSGNSTNVIEGLRKGLSNELNCYGMTGESSGEMGRLELPLIQVPASQTSHVQEAHIACLHYVCSQVDARLNEGR